MTNRFFPVSPRNYFVFAFLSAAVSLGAAPLKVDLNPDNGRHDVQTPRWENWAVKEGAQAVHTFGALTFTLRPLGSPTLGTDWWKLGYDTGATLGSDGVFAKNAKKGGGLELVMHGLAPGHHSLVTYHNSLWKESVSACSLAVDGDVKLRGIKASRREPSDFDLGRAYVEFEAQPGKDVIIALRAEGDGAIDNVILNGFALDATDPAKLADTPSPAEEDEHAVEEPVLTWRPAKTAVSHQLYLGTSLESVAAATPKSPEFKGTLAAPKFSAGALSHLENYFWRVDEVDAAGAITRGDVWRFRVRHLAFPEAEGYGRFARGGREGRVIEVVNLNDSGPGSLREAVAAEGPRTVVFRVGGAIRLKSKLVVKNPYLTVAGQTAPGDGIALYGFTFGCYATHDVILRYVRIRVGDESGETLDGAGLGVGSDNCIMDHCSISWSIDEAFSSRMAKNITLQRTIIAEPLNMSVHSHYVGTGKGHSFAGSISGDIGSFHHNLLANCAGRNWSLAGGLTGGGHFSGWLDIRNNVVYNWEHRTNDGGVKALNLVGNYYIPGPASRVFHLLMPDFGTVKDPQQYYVADNAMEGKPQYDVDNWANGGVRFQEKSLSDIKLTQPEAMRLIKLDRPFCEPAVVTQSARVAYENVMADVGANYPHYDAIDARTVKDVLNRTFTFKGSKTGLPGIIDSQQDVGGYPEMKGGEAPADSDHDGIPDAWEKAHGLNPNDSADAGRVADQAGYTWLEIYLNGIPHLKVGELLSSRFRGS
jgi:hypothetical protein